MFIPIATPPFTRLGKKLESACRKALYDFSMLDNISTLAIALSGGKDSLTLLFLLKAIIGRGFDNIDLTAIYIDGDFSCGASLQKKFLQSICDKLEVKLVIKNSLKKTKKIECYSCSRERRRLIFNAARENNIKTIAFGHHRDDNIQTLLLNLFHKAEFASMLPKINMVEYNVTIIRPLIYIDQKEIITFAKQHEFLKMVCQCPYGQNSKRKSVDILLDRIEEEFPNIRSNLSLATLLYGSQKASK